MIRNLILCLLVILTSCSTLALKEVNLSDNGWNVWLDKEAGWKNDSLYAPGETELFKLYVNQPTGGWDILKEDKTVTCTLPATVEELFSKGDQYFRYHGVSWFWKEINVPTSWKGKVIRLNVEKAQFRTELYINKQLAGYDIVPETPFGFDITPYLKFGQKNLIAFRLTNPGGTRGWEDTGKMTWGKYNIFAIHDFTCLGHVNLNITDAVYVNNIFVKNQLPAGSRELEVIIDIQNLKNTTEQGKLIVTINPKTGGDALFYKTYSVAAKPGSSIHSYRIVIPEARLWDIETPVLYTCRADINFNGMNDSGQAYFGFRTFEVCNIDGFHYFYFN